MSFKTKREKYGAVTFYYKGTLQEAKQDAEKRLANLEQNTAYITRRYLEEKRRFDSHHTAIRNCKDFIELCNEELSKQNQ